MRTIHVNDVTGNIREMCIEANHYLTPDMDAALKNAVETEKSGLGKQILNQLQDNLKIAGEDMIPICQDTGMAVVFMEIGQDVHFEGGSLEEAIHEGVRQGYVEGYLRKSVVKDPLIRENTKDNTPAIIHYSIVSGDQVKITVAPKGFGSENMSGMKLFTPAATRENIEDFIAEVASRAGSNPCPPMVLGVGLGGTVEQCALLAKRALLLDPTGHSDDAYYADMERCALEKVNRLGIGPQGLGGTVTALSVRILAAPTHIAGLPCVVNMGCHVTRHAEAIL